GGNTVQFFSGDPQGLGALSNDYGTVALIRRRLLDEEGIIANVSDPQWPLLAGLAARGAHIGSVPTPLVTHSRAPGRIEDSPSDALLVLDRLERATSGRLRHLPRLAAGLAAIPRTTPESPSRLPTRMLRNARRVLRRLTIRDAPR